MNPLIQGPLLFETQEYISTFEMHLNNNISQCLYWFQVRIVHKEIICLFYFFHSTVAEWSGWSDVSGLTAVKESQSGEHFIAEQLGALAR